MSIDELEHIHSKQKMEFEREKEVLKEITADLEDLNWDKIHETEESITLIDLELWKVNYIINRKKMMERIEKAKGESKNV